MSTSLPEHAETSDRMILDLLRRGTGMSIAELADEMAVTATAVRQRLNRLMQQGVVARRTVKLDRGRPRHEYHLTADGRRELGSNFVDLALVLWEEIRSIADIEVRRGLLQRLAKRLSSLYGAEIYGGEVEERMRSLAEVLRKRKVPFEVEANPGELPVLKALGCPYTELAEQDRSICAMERMLFSEIVGEKLNLTECRLDGQECCTFQPG
jgi:predicted ArsR family transcriptional regulator